MAGIHCVTVTDYNLCTATSCVTITEIPAFTLSITGTDVLCNEYNGTADLTVTGGTSPYTYLWNWGQTTEDLSNLMAGIHCVTVTDYNLCTATSCVTITEIPAFTLSITGSNVLCGECDGTANLTVTGGTPPYTYLWDDPFLQTTEDLDILCAGTYCVIVTDANLCTNTACVTIFNDMIYTVDYTDATTCYYGIFDECDGSATVEITGGTPPYTYIWDNQWHNSPATTSETATGLCPGNYHVTFTDANLCTTIASVPIGPLMDSDFPYDFSMSKEDESPCGDCNGTATITLILDLQGDGGILDYRWNDDPPYQNTETAIGLCSGDIRVLVRYATLPAGACLYTDITTIECNGSKSTVSSNDYDNVNNSTNYIKLYPNPVKDELIIEFYKDVNNSTFELYGLLGNKVLNAKLNSNKNNVSLSNIDNGIYYYKIIHTNQTINSGKLIVIKN